MPPVELDPIGDQELRADGGDAPRRRAHVLFAFTVHVRALPEEERELPAHRHDVERRVRRRSVRRLPTAAAPNPGCTVGCPVTGSMLVLVDPKPKPPDGVCDPNSGKPALVPCAGAPFRSRAAGPLQTPAAATSSPPPAGRHRDARPSDGLPSEWLRR